MFVMLLKEFPGIVGIPHIIRSRVLPMPYNCCRAEFLLTYICTRLRLIIWHLTLSPRSIHLVRVRKFEKGFWRWTAFASSPVALLAINQETRYSFLPLHIQPFTDSVKHQYSLAPIRVNLALDTICIDADGFISEFDRIFGTNLAGMGRVLNLAVDWTGAYAIVLEMQAAEKVEDCKLMYVKELALIDADTVAPACASKMVLGAKSRRRTKTLREMEEFFDAFKEKVPGAVLPELSLVERRYKPVEKSQCMGSWLAGIT